MSITKTNIKMSKIAAFYISALLALFAITAPILSHAQAPGYAGKRFAISLELSVMPGLTLFSDDYEYSKYTSTGHTIPINHQYSRATLKHRPTLALEYILNRKSSIQFFGRYYRPMVDVTSFDSTYDNAYQITFIPSDRAKMKATSFGFRYKTFTTKNINPIGNYLSIGLEYTHINFEFNSDHFTGYDNETNQVLYGTPPPSKSNNIYLLLGLGKQYPLASFLIFNLGFEIGVPLNHLLDISRGDGGASSSFVPTFENSKNLDWTVRNATHENFKYSFLSLNLGISLFP